MKITILGMEMIMRKLGKLVLYILLVFIVSFVFAQETISIDDTNILTLKMDKLLKERNALEKKEASVRKTIEDSVNCFRNEELAKRYAELEQYKDYFEEQEYQDALVEEERQVEILVQEKKNFLELDAKQSFEKINRERTKLTDKIKELEKILLNRTYKINTTRVESIQYDKTIKAINISFEVLQFGESYDLVYSFNTDGMTPYEIAKKGAEEEGKKYSADVYYRVTKEDDTEFYVVTVTSIDVYSEDGEKVVTDFAVDEKGIAIPENEFFFNEADMIKKIKDGFVFVDGGTFIMGNDSGDVFESPSHIVTVSSFFICDHEVTSGEYFTIKGTNPNYFVGYFLPVEQVSWYDAIEYCNMLSESKGLTPCYSLYGTTDTSGWGTKGQSWNKVTCDWNADGYRLPTEAEWEYAARGGINSKGYLYSGSNDIESVAWYDKGNSTPTQSVKSKQSNELGVYDMSGNVWEWCWDWFGSYSSDNVINPHGSSYENYRILRGGSWADSASKCRVVYRTAFEPDFSYAVLGFRVVRSAIN